MGGVGLARVGGVVLVVVVAEALMVREAATGTTATTGIVTGTIYAWARLMRRVRTVEKDRWRTSGRPRTPRIYGTIGTQPLQLLTSMRRLETGVGERKNASHPQIIKRAYGVSTPTI